MENSFVDERVKYLVPLFEALVAYTPKQRKAGKGDDKGWYIISLNETRLLKATYPDERPESEKTYGTCLRQITDLKKALRNSGPELLRDKQNKFPYLTIVKHFGEALSTQFAQYKIQQNVVYREDVDTRSTPENRIELDLTAYIKHAYAVLSEPTEYTWLDLSCALALATGRRMGEIHMSAEFTPVPGESHVVGFRGQLKGKGRKIGKKWLHQHTFQIPTLVPAALVINGLTMLDEHYCKRLDFKHSWHPDRVSQETPAVNRRYSKDLNKLTKDEEWAIIGDKMTYHKFRGAYLKACLVNNPPLSAFDYMDYARSVLGDRDESTIKTYQRFDIKPDSVTRAD